jgi:hypothetical protein
MYNNFYDIYVLKTASLEKKNHDNGLLATLINVKDAFFHFYHHFFDHFAWDSWNYFPRPHFSLYGHFTATHGHKFSTARNFFKLPHLRKVAVTTATWQHWH